MNRQIPHRQTMKPVPREIAENRRTSDFSNRLAISTVGKITCDATADRRGDCSNTSISKTEVDDSRMRTSERINGPSLIVRVVSERYTGPAEPCVIGDVASEVSRSVVGRPARFPPRNVGLSDQQSVAAAIDHIR